MNCFEMHSYEIQMHMSEDHVPAIVKYALNKHTNDSLTSVIRLLQFPKSYISRVETDNVRDFCDQTARNFFRK